MFRQIGLTTASKFRTVNRTIQDLFGDADDYVRKMASYRRGNLSRRPSANKVDSGVARLVVKADGSNYQYHSYLGGGSYGRVYKFKSGPKALAVKVVLHKDGPTIGNGLPSTLVCDVVKTMLFKGGRIQVMEMGDMNVEEMIPTEALVNSFNRFSNRAAECLLDQSLVCIDWKMDNVTAFSQGCENDTAPTFRVIDVDGILTEGLEGQPHIATFSCGFIPPLRVGSSPMLTYHVKMLQIIATAYAIELTKAMFANDTYGKKGELQTMLSLGARRDKKPKAATFTDTLTELNGVQGFETVVDLLSRFERGGLANKAASLDEQRDQCRKARSIAKDWFKSGPDPKFKRAPGTIVDSELYASAVGGGSALAPTVIPTY